MAKMESRQKAAAQDIIISDQASLSRSHMRLCRRNKGREGNNVGVGRRKKQVVFSCWVQSRHATPCKACKNLAFLIFYTHLS